ncbi:MAG: SH3 domain-containing protein [Gammaproteobacteria bacterium]|nr:SH3 domain-containing protein [Gammaproteobacteria bacterium]
MKLFKGVLLPSLYLLLAATCNTVFAQTEKEDPSLAVETVVSDPDVYRVTIADPFIELHTGPGQGYPIFYVIDRGIEVRVLRRKTDWFKIVTDDGKSGWASRVQMRQTLLPSGEQFKIVELDLEDFTQRSWVLGVTGGEFESAPVFTLFTAYSFNDNLAVELHFGQSVGRKSSARFLKANTVMQPLPDLKYSPYMTLGLGRIEVSPSSTLIATRDDRNDFAQFGLGLQRYISRSFLFRLEFNEYIIFSANSTRNDNEEVNEWKFGFAVFF